MKYRFIFDEGYLGNSYVALSEEEMGIVLITLAGGHNIMLSGYKTEHLVKAIKLLRDMNKPFVDVDTSCGSRKLIGEHTSKGVQQGLVTDANNGFLHIVNLSETKTSTVSWLETVMGNGWIRLWNNGCTAELPAKFQLIAETDKFYTNSKFEAILDKCDIKYTCKEDSGREVYSIPFLKKKLEMIRENHDEAIESAGFTYVYNNDIENVEQVKLTNAGLEMFNSHNCTLKTLKLARTIADARGHIRVFSSDIEYALTL